MKLRMAWLLLALALPAAGGPLRDWLQQGAASHDGLGADETLSQAALPPGVRKLADLAYGPDVRQRLDVYLPASAGQGRPLLVMVHGGAWRLGSKQAGSVVDNKLAHWSPAGVVLVSLDYRLLPQAAVEQQADDVASALAWVQDHAAEWGANKRQLVLMGHSAGAHLVGLLSTDQALRQRHGVQPWLATVLLDSAALEVAAIMRAPHLPLYDKAFSGDAARWAALSPTRLLTAAAPPLLAVCSSRRATSCTQAQGLADKGRQAGVTVQVLPQELSHGQINQQLGLPGDYTRQVERFLQQAGWAVAP
ncbi:alpha/beta hydrolase [Aquitalea magnusonii]|uniref:Acetyl esterase/lipase n=3 Tax=Aquitalea magnusonii TaxID=332411 RepID=A0A318J9D8_9NEIS|nr:alpha/beta hydrolase [Aquitalea magnusonii]PXX45753.1 acetyl esterase/lipase [Aquitalea magnusonii]